jgi:hypothetical protein
MVPPVTATPPDNAEVGTEFDLDVRLQAVARPVSAELPTEKPQPEGTIVSCINTESACGCGN